MNAHLNALTDVLAVILRTTVADCAGNADKSHIMLAIKLFSFPNARNSS